MFSQATWVLHAEAEVLADGDRVLHHRGEVPVRTREVIRRGDGVFRRGFEVFYERKPRVRRLSAAFETHKPIIRNHVAARATSSDH